MRARDGGRRSRAGDPDRRPRERPPRREGRRLDRGAARRKSAPDVFRNRRGPGLLVRFDEERREWTISEVWAGSAAARAGLVKGERLRSINGVSPPMLDPADQGAWRAALARFSSALAAGRAAG